MVAPPRERRAPTLVTNHAKLGHAFCGRVCLHETLYSEFLRKWPGTDDRTKERELDVWLRSVDDDWTIGARKDTAPAGSDFTHWRARWDERWPAAKVDTERERQKQALVQKAAQGPPPSRRAIG